MTTLEFDVFKKNAVSRPTGAFGASTGRFCYSKGASSPVRLVVPGVLASGEAFDSGNPGPGNYEPKPSPSGRTGARRGVSQVGLPGMETRGQPDHPWISSALVFTPEGRRARAGR